MGYTIVLQPIIQFVYNLVSIFYLHIITLSITDMLGVAISTMGVITVGGGSNSDILERISQCYDILPLVKCQYIYAINYC